MSWDFKKIDCFNVTAPRAALLRDTGTDTIYLGTMVRTIVSLKNKYFSINAELFSIEDCYEILNDI